MEKNNLQLNNDSCLVSKVKNGKVGATYYSSNQPYFAGEVPSCRIQSCFFNIVLMESFDCWTDDTERHWNERFTNMPVLYFYGKLQQDWHIYGHWSQCWDFLIKTDKGNFSLKSEWPLHDAFIQPPAIAPKGIYDGYERCFVQGFLIDPDILQAISSAKRIKFVVSGMEYEEISSQKREADLAFNINADDFSRYAQDFLVALLPTEQGALQQKKDVQPRQIKEVIGWRQEIQEMANAEAAGKRKKKQQEARKTEEKMQRDELPKLKRNRMMWYFIVFLVVFFYLFVFIGLFNEKDFKELLIMTIIFLVPIALCAYRIYACNTKMAKVKQDLSTADNQEY